MRENIGFTIVGSIAFILCVAVEGLLLWLSMRFLQTLGGFWLFACTLVFFVGFVVANKYIGATLGVVKQTRVGFVLCFVYEVAAVVFLCWCVYGTANMMHPAKTFGTVVVVSQLLSSILPMFYRPKE